MREAPWWPVAILGAVSLAAYALLSQRTEYGDGVLFLELIHQGRLWSWHAHHLYMPMVAAWSGLLAPLGIGVYEAAALLSAVGTAAGVVLVYLATERLGAARSTAWMVTALVAACPAIVFFATVVEVHGVFFAFFGLAALAAAHLRARPTASRAVLLGASTALAYCVHATGHLLPVLLLACFFAWSSGPRARRRDLGLAVLVCAVHAGLVLGLVPAISALLGGSIQARSAVAFLGERAEAHLVRPGLLPRGLLWEWIVPFLPLSVVWLAGLRGGATRALAWGFLVVLLVYTVTSFFLLGEKIERGAYFLPLAWPAAWLAAHALPRPVVLGLLVAGLGLAVVEVAAHDEPERARSYADGVRELADGHPVLILMGSDRDREACAIALEGTESLHLPTLVVAEPSATPNLAQLFTEHVNRRLGEGYRVYLTAGARDILEHHPAKARFPLVDVLLRCIDDSYELAPAEARGFRGYRLSAKPPERDR